MAWGRKCFRWRTLVLTLFVVIVTLNVLVFLTLPAIGRHIGDPQLHDWGHDAARKSNRQDHSGQAVSHLQAPRKRLNKSNFTSDSLGADGIPAGGGGERRGGGGGGGAAWEEGIGDHPPHQLHSQGGGGGGGAGKGVESQNRGNAQRGGWSNSVVVGSESKEKTASVSSVLWKSNFTDPAVDSFVRMLVEKGLLDLSPGMTMKDEDYWAYLKRQRLRRKAGIQLPSYRGYKATTNWERFHMGIHQHYLYDPDDPFVEKLLDDLTQREIVDIEQKEGGTQLKLIITFTDEGQALFKPMRFPRDIETLPDHFYFADFERHVSEIAAFHLDRVLGFNRVPPVAGRLVNMTQDIRRLADGKLARTFFISPAGNLCFHGSCSYYCDSGHPVCGHPDQLEGSLMAFLPTEKMARRQTWRNPWKRSYSKHRKAYWEVYPDLCQKVLQRSPYNSGRRLLDIVDMSVLDFLMGNLDRHHYETFRSFGNDSILLHLDNGRGFGKTEQEDVTCMAPLLQCCRIRLSTLQRLVRFYAGPTPLSSLMRASLSRDRLTALNPVLTEGHLRALDRRVLKILQAVRQCAVEQEDSLTLEDVIVDDGVV